MLLINSPSNEALVAAPVVTQVTGAVAAASMRLLLPHCFGMDVVVMHFVVFVVVALFL